MNISIFDGVASGHHHAVAQIDSGVAHAGGVVGSFEKDQISGLCFGLADVLAFLPQAVGGGAPHIVAVLVVHPADIAAAIEAGFRGRAAPDVRCAHILLGFLVDGGELFIRQGFRRNLIINTRCAGAIGATGRQTAVEQVCVIFCDK